MVITPETKIADLLKEYPHLLDVLADYSPAFGKLRNPFLRRTFGRLTTLAQAAAIGGVDLTDLVWLNKYAAHIDREPGPRLDDLYSREMGMIGYGLWNAAVLTGALVVGIGFAPLMLAAAFYLTISIIFFLINMGLIATR